MYSIKNTTSVRVPRIKYTAPGAALRTLRKGDGGAVEHVEKHTSSSARASVKRTSNHHSASQPLHGNSPQSRIYCSKTQAILLNISIHYSTVPTAASMTSNSHENPWEDQRSQQGHSNPNNNPYQGYQEHPQNPYLQQPPQGQNTSPWGQETSQGLSQNPYNQYQQSSEPPNQQQPSQTFYTGQEGQAPGLPPRRSATDMALPTGEDRSHQIEVMQSYEAAGRKDEDDSNVETLQREFPKIDGSLIAAIYGDSKSLSATREMLQALE